jgi:tetratricopeptide (TPR) repeat protein
MAEQSPPPAPTPPRRRVRGRLPWLGAAALAAAAAGFAVWWFRSPGGTGSLDPRLTFETPFRNVRPHVKYLGDESCVGCHGDIATTYAEHSMGQSCFPIAEASAVEKIDKTARFEALGLEYLIERTPGGFKHHERLRDAKGNELFHTVHDVAFAVGSGTRGRSYLIERGNQLFQSPISWYSHTAQWDLAPGYTKNNWHFERLIPPRCVYCHANQTDPVASTNNRYEPPLFRGHAIGCERCHGPGELHVARQENGERYAGPDDTIVNPRRLTGALRDDVCGQCHLQGEERVLRRGRAQYDFRPGLPLTLFEVVFVRHPDLVDYQKSVGQFEQLVVSACSKMSTGGLGCISCHDPHFKPAPAEAPAFFRARCEQCHADAGDGGESGKQIDCSAPLAERQATNDNSCIACHMPRGDSSNIAHTSVTDHRIVRRPQPAAKTGPRKLLPWELPVAAFHQERLADDPELERDIGVVLAGLAERHKSNVPALQAHKRLHQALERHPDDLAAREAFGASLLWQGRHAEAAEQFAKVLAREPERESALFQAAICAALHKGADETSLLKKLIEVNPHHSFYWTRLADVHAAKNDWPAARLAAEKALELNQAAPEARRTLIQALTRVGDLEQARRHVAIYEALGAKDAAAVRAFLGH